ncbi:nucleotide pyrophosphohydrolase [Chryseobacterium sp. cx-311]|uniref:nucleotide pyrophosphohydrolase n=1 Tax=Marnyiella aurantia TaxID=2758037 RepID=UPI001AE5AC92|nr:nucleotide pyrophosphohydrolase [Marnyiella aurantia]MBP0613926.1 nucleotide pyrophosphohydrolase [Marnyiella aurantia]
MSIKNKFNYTDVGIPFLGIETIPNEFVVEFVEINEKEYPQVKVLVSNLQAGDVINDNSYIDDGYRYHDVFHYTFATLLGWSPCTRAMLKRKRKSDKLIDRVEDGARAIITEEAISLMLFNSAKKNDFYSGINKVDPTILEWIKLMTNPFEVRSKTVEEWEMAILKGYALFRNLINNKGGRIKFNTLNKTINYQAI